MSFAKKLNHSQNLRNNFLRFTPSHIFLSSAFIQNLILNYLIDFIKEFLTQRISQKKVKNRLLDLSIPSLK